MPSDPSRVFESFDPVFTSTAVATRWTEKNPSLILTSATTSPVFDWSEKNLQATLVGHWVEFEGWLYFDVGHADQAENTAPGNSTNWRGTAWEIHPVTRILVVR